MPGMIQVSILELRGLPSGTPSSSIRIKVSVGKQVSEAQEKGDFSFPLTTLRDHLIVRIQDFEGNEIAQTVVETRLIVEKGFWDDLFPLEGGGHIHMRLLFVLSEEERNRIRVVRESALRKKQEELLLKRRHESSAVPCDDSQKNIHQTNSEEARHADDLTVKSHTDRGEETFYKEASHGAEVTQWISPQKQEPLEKTPSNVRKMIIAFESSLAQEMTSHINPRSKKPQLSRRTMDVTLKGPSLKSLGTNSDNANPTNPHVASVSDPSVPKRSLQKDPMYTMNRGYIGIEEASHQEKSFRSTKESKRQSNDQSSTKKNKSHILCKVDDYNEEEVSLENLHGASISETTELLGRLGHVLSCENQCSDVLIEEQGSRDTSVIKENQWDNCLELSQDGVKSSEKSYEYYEKEFYSSGGFQGWIFLDEAMCSCIVTGNKLSIDIFESCPSGMASETCQGKLSGASVVPKKDDKISSRREKSEYDSPVKNGASKGPMEQAIKIAIMIGFGLLVLFTRQRKQRKYGQ